MKKRLLPMNLQMFAEPSEGGEGQNTDPPGTNQGSQQQAPPVFDYEKLASIIEGKQSVTEDTVLKNYFKQKGMSKEEMESAISAFKEKRKETQPDTAALQEQIAQAQKAATQAAVEKEGLLLGLEMGLETKTVPYILKMIDITVAVKEDGTVDKDKLKEAINQVITDVPALKQKKDAGHGFQQVGSDGGSNQGGENQSSIISGIFGNSK